MAPVVNDEADTQPIFGRADAPVDAVSIAQIPNPSNSTTAIVLVTVVCVTMISSLLAGLVTVGLPTMAHELELSPSVLLWWVKSIIHVYPNDNLDSLTLLGRYLSTH